MEPKATVEASFWVPILSLLWRSKRCFAYSAQKYNKHVFKNSGLNQNLTNNHFIEHFFIQVVIHFYLIRSMINMNKTGHILR